MMLVIAVLKFAVCATVTRHFQFCLNLSVPFYIFAGDEEGGRTNYWGRREGLGD